MEDTRPPTSAIVAPARQQEQPINLIPVHHQHHQQQQQHHYNKRGYHRGNYHGSHHQSHQQQIHHQSRRNEPIIISDGEGSDPIEIMDDNYDPGLPGYYYGGYGTCHRCGKLHIGTGLKYQDCASWICGLKGDSMIYLFIG